MKTIQRGDIFIRHFDTTTPPKQKFFVVMGETETELLGYFFVNSNINKYIERHTAFFEMQMSISPTDYSFLTHTSFIAAHKLDKLSKATLIEELNNSKATYKGKLTQEDRERLLDAVLRSDLFSENEKKLFI